MERVGSSGYTVCDESCELDIYWANHNEGYEGEKAPRYSEDRQTPCGIELKLTLRLTETRDGKKYYDPAPHSTEMVRLNSAFSSLHGLSSLLNLGGFIATCWYGFSLAERIQ